ncbi:MAG: hypothetical protein ACK595_03595 [Planctomycetota bacterium]
MPATSRPPRPRWSLRARLLLAACARRPALTAVALLLHAAPGLLPEWFRRRYPPNGIELFTPGVLDRIPVTELPLPYGVTPYRGAPPHDLVDLGLATLADAEVDRREVPTLSLPIDSDGLPNVTRPARPDLLLVGDSFTGFGAQREPTGLQHELERLLPATVLNVAISGIGPDQELFLMRRVGLPAEPRLCVWFFFGGNDVVDSLLAMLHHAQGIGTLGELFAGRRAPRLLLPALVGALLTPEAPAKAPVAGPLPGLPLRDRPERRLWFYPDTLRVMAQPRAALRDNPGWLNLRAVLARAKAAADAAGSGFLVVFVPAKEQVYLPLVADDPALLQRFAVASPLHALLLPDDARALQQLLLANRAGIEQELARDCAAAGIAFWSATPTIEAVAAAGVPAYYACDSHWRAEAQRAVAAALAAHVRDRNLLPR